MWLIAVALCFMVAVTASAQRYDAKECGSNPVNWVKAQFAALDPGRADVAAEFEALTDLYWSDPANRWCSPSGQPNTGWGHDKGLMYFALYDAGRTYLELTCAGATFSPRQQAKFRAVLLDALQAAMDGSFYYFGQCNLYRGRVNIDNSCAEDDESISKFLALIHNLFPEVAEQVGGETVVAARERSFYEKAFSTDYEHGGGLRLVNGAVTQPNHGGASWPYAGVNLTGANNARDTYLLAGKPVPDWYRNANALALFHELQTKALPDGSAFATDCRLNSGKVVPCNDPGEMNAVPTMLPAGRFVRATFGDQAFTPGLYTFERCDLSRITDPNRANQYCDWNPGVLQLGIVTNLSPPSQMNIRWHHVEGAERYDVWWLGARVKAGIAATDTIVENVPCDTPLTYAVYARDKRGRTLGGASGTTSKACVSRPARAHLGR
ncbi:MAG: hypothetical protein ACHQQS_13550 [Thermoanaerobaculales bacterium]